jgi:E3 ubiquitin-protein ligase SHPRH
VTPFAMDAEKKVVDSPAKKKQVQKGDFIFK